MNGGKYTADELAQKCLSLWPDHSESPFIVFTGGEPLLQLDDEVLSVFKNYGFFTAVETNGTIEAPTFLDWVCMSPKANTDILLTSGDEIKVVMPQKGIDPQDFIDYDFSHFFIQPMDNEAQADNIIWCINYCKTNPKWSLSLQTHKVMGID